MLVIQIESVGCRSSHEMTASSGAVLISADSTFVSRMIIRRTAQCGQADAPQAGPLSNPRSGTARQSANPACELRDVLPGCIPQDVAHLVLHAPTVPLCALFESGGDVIVDATNNELGHAVPPVVVDSMISNLDALSQVSEILRIPEWRDRHDANLQCLQSLLPGRRRESGAGAETPSRRRGVRRLLGPVGRADDFPRQTSHGVQASVTANLNRWFGIVGDLGVQFNTATDLGPGFVGQVARTNVCEYLVGPRFTARSGRVGVFGHFLIGTATGDAGQEFSGFSDSGLMLGGGGGIDVDLNRRFAVRAQFDKLGAFVDIAEVTSRFAVGLVVKLGG